MEVLPRLQGDLESLDLIYLKAPGENGGSNAEVPLSRVAHWSTDPVQPLSVSHQSQFPAVTLSFNLTPGVALGEATAAVERAGRAAGAGVDPGVVPGQCPGLSIVARHRAAADPGRAGRGLPGAGRALRKLRAPDHDPLDAALGRRRRAA